LRLRDLLARVSLAAFGFVVLAFPFGLGSPPSSGFLLSFALIGRKPRPVQRLTDVRAEPFDRFLDIRGMDIAVTELAPIQILAFGDDGEDRIVFPPGAVLQLWNLDVKNGEHEIASA